MSRTKLEKLKSSLCDTISSSGARLEDVLKTLREAGFEVRQGAKSTHYIGHHLQLTHPNFINGTLSFAEKKGIVKVIYVKSICKALDAIMDGGNEGEKDD